MADRPADGGGAAGLVLPRLLSVGQAAAYFNRSERSLRRWIASGRLPVARVGRSVFVPIDEVRRIVQREVTRKLSAGAGDADLAGSDVGVGGGVRDDAAVDAGGSGSGGHAGLKQ